MKGIGGCLLVILGFVGIYFSIILSFTFYFLPLAFFVFIGSLVLISFALGPAGPANATHDRKPLKNHQDEKDPPVKNG